MDKFQKKLISFLDALESTLPAPFLSKVFFPSFFPFHSIILLFIIEKLNKIHKIKIESQYEQHKKAKTVTLAPSPSLQQQSSAVTQAINDNYIRANELIELIGEDHFNSIRSFDDPKVRQFLIQNKLLPSSSSSSAPQQQISIGQKRPRVTEQSTTDDSTDSPMLPVAKKLKTASDRLKYFYFDFLIIFLIFNNNNEKIRQQVVDPLDSALKQRPRLDPPEVTSTTPENTVNSRKSVAIWSEDEEEEEEEELPALQPPMTSTGTPLTTTLRAKSLSSTVSDSSIPAPKSLLQPKSVTSKTTSTVVTVDKRTRWSSEEV